MAGGARVELLGYTDVRRKFSTAPKAVQKTAVQTIQREADPMLRAARGAAFTPIQRHAARTLLVRKDRLGAEVAAAATGTDLDRALYYGGEYGGRKSRKVTYATRSPAGRAYIVRRRTTMQFLPHLGREGYFLWPTVREWLPRINKAIGEAVREVLA